MLCTADQTLDDISQPTQNAKYNRDVADCVSRSRCTAVVTCTLRDWFTPITHSSLLERHSSNDTHAVTMYSAWRRAQVWRKWLTDWLTDWPWCCFVPLSIHWSHRHVHSAAPAAPSTPCSAAHTPAHTHTHTHTHADHWPHILTLTRRLSQSTVYRSEHGGQCTATSKCTVEAVWRSSETNPVGSAARLVVGGAKTDMLSVSTCQLGRRERLSTRWIQLAQQTARDSSRTARSALVVVF